MSKAGEITWKHIRRRPYQALAAVAVLTVTLLAVSIFSLLTLGSNQVLKYLATRPQIAAYFQDEATLEQINQLKTELEAQPVVKSVKFVSKQEALAIYREQNKNDPMLLEMVTAEVLPASLEISGVNSEVLAQIAQMVSGKPGVEEVVFPQDVINTFTTWARAIKIVGLTLGVFLAGTSMLIIMIIVGMKIALRKREIEVLRLVGANKNYIVNPFMLEGASYGLVAGVIAWGVTYILLLYATPFLVSFLGEIPVLPVPVTTMLMLLGGELALGGIIGGVGSGMAVNRFLGKK